MTKLEARFLTATPADAGALAELVQLASEGLGLHLWTKLAAGGDPWSVGRARLSRETAALSYRNAVIAKLGGQPVAGLISYPLGDKADSIPDDEPAVLVPLHELMNLAPGTWYVHAVAAYPQHTGQGYGSALLAKAERFAAAAGQVPCEPHCQRHECRCAPPVRAMRLRRDGALQDGQGRLGTRRHRLGTHDEALVVCGPRCARQ